MPSHAPSAPFSTRLDTSGPQEILQRLKVWFVARQTRRALMQLGPRELADIGLAPETIDATAERVARQ